MHLESSIQSIGISIIQKDTYSLSIESLIIYQEQPFSLALSLSPKSHQPVQITTVGGSAIGDDHFTVRLFFVIVVDVCFSAVKVQLVGLLGGRPKKGTLWLKAVVHRKWQKASEGWIKVGSIAVL